MSQKRVRFRHCCVPTCVNRRNKSREKCHRFPISKVVAEDWVRAVNNPKLKTEEAHLYCLSKFVCHRHFATHQYTTPERLRLNRCVVPTLFLPSPDNSENYPSGLEIHKVESSVRSGGVDKFAERTVQDEFKAKEANVEEANIGTCKEAGSQLLPHLDSRIDSHEYDDHRDLQLPQKVQEKAEKPGQENSHSVAGIFTECSETEHDISNGNQIDLRNICREPAADVGDSAVDGRELSEICDTESDQGNTDTYEDVQVIPDKSYTVATDTWEYLPDEVCRLCASGDEHQKQSIVGWLRMLNEIIPDLVAVDDGLPQHICRPCTNRLYTCNKIKAGFIDAYKKLQECLGYTKSPGIEFQHLASVVSGHQTCNEFTEADLESDVVQHFVPEDEERLVSEVEEQSVSEVVKPLVSDAEVQLVSQVEEHLMAEVEEQFVPEDKEQLVSEAEEQLVSEVEEQLMAEVEEQFVPDDEQLVSEVEKQFVPEDGEHLMDEVEEQFVPEDEQLVSEVEEHLMAEVEEQLVSEVEEHLMDKVEEQFLPEDEERLVSQVEEQSVSQVMKPLVSDTEIHLVAQVEECLVTDVVQQMVSEVHSHTVCGALKSSNRSLLKGKEMVINSVDKLSINKKESAILCTDNETTIDGSFALAKSDPACNTSNACDMNIQEEEAGNKKYKYVCGECKEMFTVKGALRKHKLTHFRMVFECDYCKKQCRSVSHLNDHRRIHTKELPFMCEYCGKCFRTRVYLNKHKFIHKPPHYTCNVCNKECSSSFYLAQHKKMHSTDTKLICEVCGKMIYTHFSLKIHMRTHTGERPFQCATCGRCFISAGKLRTHRRVHTDRKFRCVTCDKGYYLKASLMKHERCHKKREYRCPICFTLFANSENMRKHGKVYCKHPVCTICGQTLLSDEMVEEHKVTEYQKEEVAEAARCRIRQYFKCCPVCSQAIRGRRNMLKHMKEYHKDYGYKPFACERCVKTFSAVYVLGDDIEYDIVNSV